MSKSDMWKLGTAAWRGGVATSETAMRAINADGSWENKQVSPARQFPFRKYLEAVSIELGRTVETSNVLAQRLGSVMAESTVGPSTVARGQEVLAHDVALLLSNRGGGSVCWAHRLPNQVAVVTAHRGGRN